MGAEFFEWIAANKMLSGAGAVLLSGIGWIIRRAMGPKEAGAVSPSPIINITQNNGVDRTAHGESSVVTKNSRRILFIDDDTQFKVVKVMKAAGIPNVRIVKDIRDLNAAEVQDTDIFFVDIQGVGLALGFSDEGLGIALALKSKYPNKKVVIYSAQTNGDRFHKALNKADASLPKNADPYQFVALVEDLSGK